MFITKQTHALYGDSMLRQEAHLVFVFDFPAKAVLLFIFQYFYQDRTTDTFSRICGNVAFPCKCQSYFLQLLVLIWCCETLIHYSHCTPVLAYCNCSAKSFYLQLDRISVTDRTWLTLLCF